MRFRALALLIACSAAFVALARSPDGIPKRDPDVRLDDRGEPLPLNALACLGGGRYISSPSAHMAVAFHPDGRHFATLDYLRHICVWNLESGREAARWEAKGDVDAAFHLFYRPDGRLCYSANNTLSVFEVGKPTPVVTTLPGQTEAVSPGGRWTLSRAQLGDVGQISFVDALIPARRIRFAEHKKLNAEDDRNFSAAISGDASTLAILRNTDENRTVLEVWNATAHRRALVDPQAIGMDRIPFPAPLGVSADGRWVAIPTFRRIDRWRVVLDSPLASPSLKPMPSIPTPGANCAPRVVRFAAEGSIAYIGNEKGIVCEVDVAAGRVLRTWRLGWADIASIDLSPDGRTLIAAAWQIHVIDLVGGKERFAHEGHPDVPRWLCFDPTGRTLVSTSSGRVCLWDMTPRSAARRAEGAAFVGGRPKAVLNPTKLPFSVGAFATESRRLFVHNADEMLAVDPDRARVIRSVFEGLDGADFRCWAYAPDGDSLAVSTDLNTIHRIDARSGRAIGATIRGVGKLDDMEMLPDNRTLALLEEGGTVAFRDMATGAEIPPERIDPRKGGTDRRFVNSFSFSNRRLTIWDRFTGRTIARTDAIENYNNSLSPSGRYAYLIRERSIVLWEVLSGQKLALPFEHPKGVLVSHLQISPDSNRLVTAANDSRLYVWDHDLKRPAKPLSKTDLDDAWATMAKDSLANAWRAMGELATPAGIARIDTLVDIAAPAEIGRVAGLIAELDSARFAVRERASRDLLKLAPLAEGQLREALRLTASEEVSSRLKRIVDTLSGAPSSERLRALRLCELLEKDASAPALKLLGRLRASADLTVALSAADALERLRRLPPPENLP